MRGTFQVEASVAGLLVTATVSGYDDNGDYNNPPDSNSEVEEISCWDEENNCEVQFETLSPIRQSRIETALSEAFFEKLAQNDTMDGEY